MPARWDPCCQNRSKPPWADLQKPAGLPDALDRDDLPTTKLILSTWSNRICCQFGDKLHPLVQGFNHFRLYFQLKERAFLDKATINCWHNQLVWNLLPLKKQAIFPDPRIFQESSGHPQNWAPLATTGVTRLTNKGPKSWRMRWISSPVAMTKRTLWSKWSKVLSRRGRSTSPRSSNKVPSISVATQSITSNLFLSGKIIWFHYYRSSSQNHPRKQVASSGLKVATDGQGILWI